MVTLTRQQLISILPGSAGKAEAFLAGLSTAMDRFKITGRLRQSAFIAQIGHESGQLCRLVENLNYSAEALIRTWPTRFNAELAKEYARKPERIANAVYNARMGNIHPGDGWRFRGRGLIQLTGRSNYAAAGKALGIPLEDQPELLEQPEAAALSASWWWAAHGLNELADAGRFQDIGSIINTGKPGRVPHGAAERKALYDRALKVLS